MAKGLWQCKYQSSHTERELLHCYPNRALEQPFVKASSAATACAPLCVICVTLRTSFVTFSTFFTCSFHPIFDFPFWYLCSEHLLRIHNCKSLWQTMKRWTMRWQLSCTCTHIVLDFYICCRIFSTKYKRMLLRFKRTEGYCSNSLSANHDNENW